MALERRLAEPVAVWLRRRPTPPPDVEATAWTLVHVIKAITHRWLLDPPSGADPRAFAQALTRLLAAGL